MGKRFHEKARVGGAGVNTQRNAVPVSTLKIKTVTKPRKPIEKMTTREIEKALTILQNKKLDHYADLRDRFVDPKDDAKAQNLNIAIRKLKAAKAKK